MASETEMRRIMLHAADKLTNARTLTVTCERTHGPRTLALPIEFYVATTYAETVLRMLASYLTVEEPSGKPARDEQGRFLKSEAKESSQ